MPIKLHISPKIIPSISSLYNDVNRIFMEYIDNSLDSAEFYFNKENNLYSKKIQIQLIIEGENYKTGKVTITDNCVGITNFNKVVENIGDSDKKAQGWTNGQFGYGIYSFMAACTKLEITSKLKENKNALYLPINKEQFNTARQEDVTFPDPKEVPFSSESGTTIILSGFEKNLWKQIDTNFLKEEIEKHFELLLGRENLEIKLTNTQSTLKCKAFNYDEFDGDVYAEEIKNLSTSKGRKKPEHLILQPKNPIKVFLKLTKGKTINKNPVFIIKGRRIAEIKDVKSFRSCHKSDIWGHPNLTGYINIGDFLEPTIARTDFKNTHKSKAIYEKLIELEPLILEFIKEINRKSEEKHFKELEDRLNSALSKLAKIDNMLYRTEYITGNKNNLEGGTAGKDSEKDTGGKDRGDENNSIENPKNKRDIGENKGDGNQENEDENENKNPGGTNFGDYANNKEKENPFEDSDYKGSEKKKSGFNIKIVDMEPQKDEEDNMLRSMIIGSEIRIFKKHPSFEERVDISRKGESKISQRLITYLAGEITVHYKDIFAPLYIVELPYFFA